MISLVAVLATTFCAMAQHAVGDWRIHSSFVGNNVTAVAESNRWVYYLTGGYLFRLDKETQENEALSIINDLSDMIISQAYYNSERDYLVLIYENGNIDIILSDGSVVNMPEVKDAVMTSSKNINDVTFAEGCIYLATDFGYVVIDDEKFVVKESHIYRTPLTTVAQVGPWLLLSTTDNFYYGNADEYHDQLKSFYKASLRNNCRIRPINDSTFFCLTDTSFVVDIKSIGIEGVTTYFIKSIIEGRTTQCQATLDGWLLNVPDLKKCFKTDAQGLNPTPVDTVGELCSSNPRGDGKLWAVGANGLHQSNSQSYFYPNTLSYNKPYWMTYNKSKNLLYVSSGTAIAPIVNGTAPSYINTFDGITWKDVTPEDAPEHGTYWLEFMPDDPDTYFVGSWREGLLKVTNDKIVLKYDTINSPITYKGSILYRVMHPITSIDRNVNLWVVQSYENPNHPAMVLPAAKLKLGQVQIEDWITPQIKDLNSGHTQRASFISTKRGNYAKDTLYAM